MEADPSKKAEIMEGMLDKHRLATNVDNILENPDMIGNIVDTIRTDPAAKRFANNIAQNKKIRHQVVTMDKKRKRNVKESMALVGNPLQEQNASKRQVSGIKVVRINNSGPKNAFYPEGDKTIGLTAVYIGGNLCCAWYENDPCYNRKATALIKSISDFAQFVTNNNEVILKDELKITGDCFLFKYIDSVISELTIKDLGLNR